MALTDHRESMPGVGCFSGEAQAVYSFILHVR